MIVLSKAFDDTFAQTIYQRTSCTAGEIRWNARFTPRTRIGSWVLEAWSWQAAALPHLNGREHACQRSQANNDLILSASIGVAGL